MKSKVLSIIVLVSALAIASRASAAGNSYTVRSEGCHTYSIFAHQADKAIEGVACGTQPVESVKRNPTITPEVPVIVHVDIPVVTDTPEDSQPTEPQDTPEPREDKKPHCNKGEGNGGEGCDPGNNPDKGNDDEN